MFGFICIAVYSSPAFINLHLHVAGGRLSGVRGGNLPLRVSLEARRYGDSSFGADGVTEAGQGVAAIGGIDDVVEVTGAGRDVVESHQGPQLPGNVVVSARGITADSDTSDERTIAVVEAETTAEHVDTSHLAAAQAILVV